ncbi:MAG: hypothetical protein JNM18_26285 [Planctomycetaceae bacterium]|nr:hypothetical protein [Planctomycetaceae bacterium]
MSSSSPNANLLAEVNQARLWFRARKTRPIWARLLAVPQTVKTLEGPETVPAGTYLCRGEAGDIWPQTAERLLTKYVATSTLSADGWQQYQPQPDAQGVWAAQIGHPFTVHAAWGKLNGKPGDFLVKDFSDGETEYPADVWVVEEKLFAATYERG